MAEHQCWRQRRTHMPDLRICPSSSCHQLDHQVPVAADRLLLEHHRTKQVVHSLAEALIRPPCSSVRMNPRDCVRDSNGVEGVMSPGTQGRRDVRGSVVGCFVLGERRVLDADCPIKVEVTCRYCLTLLMCRCKAAISSHETREIRHSKTGASWPVHLQCNNTRAIWSEVLQSLRGLTLTCGSLLYIEQIA